MVLGALMAAAYIAWGTSDGSPSQSAKPTAWTFSSHIAPSGDNLCSSSDPRDYAAPLDRLPSIRQLPARKHGEAGSHLPFAPSRLAFYPWSRSPILVGGGSYKYSFYDEGLASDPLTLNWLVTARLVAVKRSGAEQAIGDEVRLAVESVDDAYQPTLAMQVPQKVGFYRVDLRFANDQGKELGSYSEYLRVMRPIVRLRLGIDGRRFKPRQHVRTRVENLGTIVVSDSMYLQLEKQIPGGGWRRLPSADTGGFRGPRLLLAGEAGDCVGMRLPAELSPGRYRILRPVGISAGKIKGRTLSTVIRVTR